MTNKENLAKQINKAKIGLPQEVEKKTNDIEEKHIQEIKLINDRNKKILAVIGHDIKTPISSIIGFLTTLKDSIHQFDKRKIDEYIDISLFSAKKSFILLNNLLEWAFAENSIKAFTLEYVNLNGLLKEVIDGVQIYASDKLISIETINISTELVLMDKNMIKTVLRNLLNNAIKYTNKDGEIVVSTIKNDEYIEISVKDSGIGINEEELSSIFKIINYNSISGTFNESSSRFGLLLCKEFIDIHKGKIWIISKPGEGSEFKFTLPLSLQ
jgi:signal transduction histidine kinase